MPVVPAPATGRPQRARTGVAAGPDGRPRCPWALSAPEYIAYHDEEWGRPVHDTVGLFERLSLEAFQSGLSWLTILRKREAFRRAFAGFDPTVVASFDSADVERLMADAGIVRNRRKILATISNARAVLALDVPVLLRGTGPPEARKNYDRATFGPLGELVWSFRPAATAAPLAPAVIADVPASTAESVALAKALKASGIVFVGPTTAYALMQACGLVNDHLAACVNR